MDGKIHGYLADDHRRLDGLLDRVISDSETIDAAAYGQFRSGLLKHIAMEEKIILPAAQKRRGGAALPLAAKLRLDHGALTALLVPTPTASVVAAIRAILKLHNPLEEDPGGMYDQCDELAGTDAEQILQQLCDARDVRVVPNVDGPHIIDAARRALARAGYDFVL
jgi:hypothetical protein